MVIAGHETVAAALAWTLMLLAEHQPAQDRVRAELERARTARCRCSVTARRCRGPGPSSTRRCASSRRPGRSRAARYGADVVGGHDVPAGHAGHHQPLAGAPSRPTPWTDPLAFRPERFLDADAGARPPTCRSGRGRGCASAASSRWARWSSCSAELLRDHRVDVPPGWSRPAAQAQVAVHPRGGMPLRRHPRCRRPRR